MNQQSTLGVSSYFIGVSIGDAAIHILWSTDGGMGRDEKTVLRAVMVDGGGAWNPFQTWANRLPHRFVTSAIEDIEDNYVCQGAPIPVAGGGALSGGTNPGVDPRNRLKFNAFVVTHWDHDHYQGVITFINQDFIASQALGLPGLSRAFYINNEPQTTFYAPYWDNICKPADNSTFPFLGHFHTLCMRAVQDARPDVGHNITMQIRSPGNNIWSGPMLDICVGEDNLLGRNLFSNAGYMPAGAAGCASLQTLMDLYHPERAQVYPEILGVLKNDGRWPVLYCVAANRHIVGGGIAIVNPLPGHTITATNMSSVCTLLAWHKSTDQGCYISLFSSADADAQLEDDIAHWMQYSDQSLSQVTIAKLSHHGSASSTSQTLLPALKPKCVVSMSGGNPRHGHPRWEVLHDLFTLSTLGYGNVDPFIAPNPLCLFRYPSYLVDKDNYDAGKLNRFYSNIDHVEHVFERVQERVKFLADQFGGSDEMLDQISWMCPGIYRDVLYMLRQLGWDGDEDIDWNQFIAQELNDLRVRVVVSTLGLLSTVARDDSRIWKEKKRWTAFTIVGREDHPDNEIYDMWDANGTREVGGQGLNERLTVEGLMEIESLAGQRVTAHMCQHRRDSPPGSRRSSTASSSSWEILDSVTDSSPTLQLCTPISSPHILLPEGGESLFPKKPGLTPGSFTPVPRKNTFHGFLKQLPSGYLKLASKPDLAVRSGKTAGGVRVALDTQDRLQWWLQAVLLVSSTAGKKTSWSTRSASSSATTVPLKAATMYLDASEWPPTETTAFELSVIVAMTLGGNLEVSLSLDTKAAPEALGVGPGALATMLSETNTMCLGLTVTTSTPDQWKLSHLLEFIRFPCSNALSPLLDPQLVPVSADAGGRNAMWYVAGHDLNTTVRLEFGLPKKSYDNVKEWLQTARFGLKIKDDSVRIIARRDMYFHAGLPDTKKKQRIVSSAAVMAESDSPAFPGKRLGKASEAIVRGDITFGVGVELGDMDFDFSLFVTVSHNSVRLRLQRDAPGEGKDSELTQLLKWAATHLGSRDGKLAPDGKYEDTTWGACDAWVKAASGFLDAIRPRVIEFTLGYDDKGKFEGLQTASITLQVELTLGKAVPKVQEKNKLVFFLTFRWGMASGIGFDGSLWCKAPDKDGRIDYTEALPSWERYLEVRPSDPDTTIDNVDLKKLLDIDSLPAGVPTQITRASISLDADAMRFEGAISCTYDRAKSSKVPMLILDELSVTIVRNFKKKREDKTETPASWDACLEFKMLLWPGGQEPSVNGGEQLSVAPPSALKELPCEITGGLYYSSATASTLADANKSAWTLRATIDGLTVSHLAPFWPEGPVRNAVMDTLSQIELEHLELDYYYGPKDGEGGSDFQFKGVLKLGSLKLKLDFHCNSSNGWEFGASLEMPTKAELEEGNSDSSDKPATVRTVLAALFGKDNVPTIPGGVLDVEVSRPKSDNEVLSIKCGLVNIKGDAAKGVKDAQYLVCTASIHISAISLTMAQWRDTSKANTTPKRIVKVALNDLPKFNAPLVGEVAQPFEQLVYMWVSAKPGKTPPPPPKTLALTTEDDDAAGPKLTGMTYSEFQLLNGKLVEADKIYFKAAAPDPEKIGVNDIVIEAGSHFMVVAKTPKGEVKAVLDYVFSRPKPKLPPATIIGCSKIEANAAVCIEDDVKDEKPNTEPAKAPFKKTAGPLSFENVGLTYDANKNRLGIILDATFLFGPVGLALLGFGLSVELVKGAANVVSDGWEIVSISGDSGPASAHTMTLLPADEENCAVLGSLPVANPKVSLDGLLVSFDRPPVTIAGGFVRTEMKGAIYYAGGLIVGFKPWKLMAMGVYGQITEEEKPTTAFSHRHQVIKLTDDDEEDGNGDGDEGFRVQHFTDKDKKDSFTMVFVIVKVQGPLFSVGFADISGLTAGIGVNSSIRLPSAETVLDFPLTKPEGTPSADKGPLAALTAILSAPKPDVEPWFAPREGSIWIAAGLTVTAFTMLSANAVLVVTTSPSVQVGIFGVATIDVPSLGAGAAPKFAHAEIGFACVLDPEAGTFRFDAQLSPRSFVLHESCHLSGGMALYAWAKTGDFVLTLGGYHQAFVPLEQYPSPHRLGISWSLSDALRISGEAYFAVTPRMCMGGGKLNATLNLGPLSAWFDAFLDFLINFRPFKFAADGGLAVGVRFTLDLWLVTVRIQAEIKAVLSVLGPPMAGRVHVDFWVFGFDIDFGDRDAALLNAGKQMLELDEFMKLVVKGGGSAAKGLPAPMDWVDVARETGPGLESETAAEDEQQPEPFLFNCTGGLLPESDVKLSARTSTDGTASWMKTMFRDGTVIPKDTWAVKAGDLEFSITLAFAASEIVIRDKRAHSITPKFTVPIADEQKKIYALPMHLTDKISSKVKVIIDHQPVLALDGDTPPPPRTAKQWHVVPVVKMVPNNLWGAYDPSTDPALAGNAVASLLNAPSAPGSTPLVMGMTFQPPLPFLSADKVPKFNIVKDMLQRVKNGGYAFADTETEASKEWNPIERAEAKLEWKRIVEKWDTEASEKRAGDAVGLWSAQMGWSAGQGGLLVDSRPRSLLRRFEDMVPAAPRIAAVMV